MKFASLTLAAAVLMSLTACDRSEPTAVNVESKPLPESETLRGSPLGEGIVMTQEEVAKLMAIQKSAPAVALQNRPSATAALAKTAATTCVIDFNQQAALAALTDHGSSTFILEPYNQSCYNNANIYMMATPWNLDHFHLASETPTTQCYAGGNNWGTYNSAGACVNPSDAMYWPRAASNMNGNSAIAFNAVANGYYRNFNVMAFYVRSGTVRLAAHVGGVWKYYGPCTAGQRWYMGSTVTADQVIFFDYNYNGVYTIDNFEVQILY